MWVVKVYGEYRETLKERALGAEAARGGYCNGLTINNIAIMAGSGVISGPAFAGF